MPSVTSLGVQQGRLLVGGLAREPVSLGLRISYRVGGEALCCEPLGSPGPDGCFRCRHLELQPRKEQEGEALSLGWRLVNVCSQPVMLDGVELFTSGEAWPLLRSPGGLRLYQHGFQSWTPSAAVPADSRPAYPLLRSFALMNHFVDSPLWGRKDRLISSLVTVLQGDEPERAVLLGFTTQRAGLGELFYRNRGEPGLGARLDYGGKTLQPGDSLEGEWLRLARGPADGILQDWCAALGGAMGARVPAVSPVGWCSWYEYYTRVTAEEVLRNTDFLAEHPELGVGFVQLDDGYQPAVGDWLELNDKFAAGLGKLTQHIRERGFQAGIWTAPFLAAASSRLFSEHPGWFLQAAGRPVATGFNPEWRARTYGLDLTHPEVLEWLAGVFSHLVEQGFDYHKIDFLFAGLRHGQRHDPGLSPVEAYRLGLATIRSAIGPDRFLLGCGAPIGPSVGLVDGMRVSQDVKEQWDSRLAGWAGRGCGYPAARGALRTNITRWFMHRQLWVNDPDCLMVREHRTRLTLAETETLVSVLGATGGMLFLSDELPRVSAERLDLAAAVLPPSTLVGRPSSSMGAAYPADITVEGGAGQRLVVLINWSDEPVQCPLPGSATSTTFFDFWQGGLVEDDAVTLAPHGVRVLRLVPRSPEPCIIADTFHMLAGLDGRLAGNFDSDTGVLEIVCRDVARASGRVLVGIPSDWQLEPSAHPGGVKVEEQPPGVAIVEIRHAAPWSHALLFSRR